MEMCVPIVDEFFFFMCVYGELPNNVYLLFTSLPFPLWPRPRPRPL